MAQFIYTLEKARKAHGDKVVLDNVTLSFLPGAKIGVVGPNGAGKSSLLRIMAGEDQPSNGEARLMPGYTVGLLAQEPKLLLVDEPVAGMTDAETRQTADLLKEINRDRTVVVVEHDMTFVRELGVKVTCLHEGAVLAEGTIDQVSANERVVEVYLGR